MSFSVLLTLLLSLQSQNIAAFPSSDLVQVTEHKDASSSQHVDLMAPSHLESSRQVNPDYCSQAAPGVNETAIFTRACDANPQNNPDACMQRLQGYADASAITTCQHFYTLWNGCLLALGLNENSNTTECSQQHDKYTGCNDYTLQAYAYCGCFYTLPSDISDCANVELGIEIGLESITTSSATSTTTVGTLSGPAAGTATTTATANYTTTVFVTFTPVFTPTVPMLSTPTSSPMGSMGSMASGTGGGAAGIGSTALGGVAPTTVQTLMSTPSSTPKPTTSGAGETSSAVGIVGEAEPIITGYVCAGSDCQDQRAGLKYCFREYSIQTLALPPPQIKREL